MFSSYGYESVNMFHVLVSLSVKIALALNFHFRTVKYSACPSFFDTAEIEFSTYLDIDI